MGNILHNGESWYNIFLSFFFAPKRRLDIQFVHRLDQAADIVTYELAKNFVLHGNVRLAPHAVFELRLDHAERRFHVAPLVVMGLEFLRQLVQFYQGLSNIKAHVLLRHEVSST